MDKLKVLVTGGAGFIGSSLCRILEKPVVLDWKNRKPGIISFEYVKHDIRKPLRMFGEDIEAVVHLAALTGKRECAMNPKMAREVNIGGTRNMLEFCRLQDIDQFIMASTCAAYCEKQGLYIQTKIAGEELCKEYTEKYGVNTVILRFANVYGVGAFVKDKLTVIPIFVLRALLGEPLLIEGDGSQTRDFIHINDVCYAIKKALKYMKHDTFFIGTGIETSINQLAQIIRKKMRILYGKYVTVKYVPFPQWRSKTPRADVPVDETEQKLGWKAQISIDRGIENLLMFPYYSAT